MAEAPEGVLTKNVPATVSWKEMETMEIAILRYVNRKTNVEKLEEVSTKQVAEFFKIDTKRAYDLLSSISQKCLITKLPPVNGDKFSCCGWLRLTDEG